MTTPTPDQGALERARELYETTAHFYAIDRLWIHNIAAAMTAAVSEARAAGYSEGIDKSAAHQPLSAETSERIWRLASDLDSKNPGHTEARLVELVAGSLTRERELRYRALTTPAQSPGTGWKISDETAAELESADNNLRDAPQRAREAPPLGATPTQSEGKPPSPQTKEPE